MKAKMPKTEEEWKKKLTPEQYKVLRQKGTEPAFTGKLLYNKESGIYRCMACGAPLFSSDTKFESGTGWPSFFKPISKDAIEEKTDSSYGMTRAEITCKNCGGHLGHVFHDAPQTPTGLRYCLNSCSLDFEKEKKEKSRERRFVKPKTKTKKKN